VTVSVKIIYMDKQTTIIWLFNIDTCYLKNCKRIIESQQKPSRENSKIIFIRSEYCMFPPQCKQTCVNECSKHV
jgi:hypothetical protein